MVIKTVGSNNQLTLDLSIQTPHANAITMVGNHGLFAHGCSFGLGILTSQTNNMAAKSIITVH